MELDNWISFVLTTLIITLTPGPSVLLVTSNSLNYGSKKTLSTILGDLTANFFQILFASFGLATIVVTFTKIYSIIKWIGVLYLIYIGISKIIYGSKIDLKKIVKQKNSIKLFSEGFFMSASNPKAIIFFASYFPLFINQKINLVPQIIILCITFLVIDGLSLFLYSQFSQRFKVFLENNSRVNFQNKIVGILLILCGIYLSKLN
jgi:threonine/homoserine/homoserine lactone efflux protein